MRSSRAKRQVRHPFVVTVTMAVVAGCGAKLDGEERRLMVNPPECPATPPSEGETCSGDLTCTFGDCYGSPTTTATCTSGRWNVARSSCNPPMPTCPVTEPKEGTYCESLPGRVCEYADACIPGTKNRLECVSGKWRKASAAMLVACPTTLPAEGSSCAPCAGRYPSQCNYEMCGDRPMTYAKCDPVTETWTIARTTCNPPPPSYDAGTDP